LFSLSGAVQKPGNYELPLGGATFRELIEVHGGGMMPGRTLRGVLPAGVSAPILPASKLDVRLDYDSVKAAGSMLGSASIIVVDDSIDMVRAATRMIEFFRHESCGKCTPCREGTMWLEKIYHRIGAGGARAGDVAELLRVSKQISGNVLCALGDFATSPVTSTIEHFRGDYERLIPLGKPLDARGAHPDAKNGAAP
jgi:NADH-quinone oxidoreductase subunit F